MSEQLHTVEIELGAEERPGARPRVPGPRPEPRPAIHLEPAAQPRHDRGHTQGAGARQLGAVGVSEAVRPRRGGPPSLIRADPSGMIRRCLCELIAGGRELRVKLEGMGCETELARERERIEAWRLECLRAVARGFEQEAVAELAGALSRAPDEGRGALVRMHRRRVSDALALIEALESTLERSARGEQRGGPAPGELGERTG